ncbi:MAG: hypothetical protein AAF517_21060, partial [Planctomycetota bacterium]
MHCARTLLLGLLVAPLAGCGLAYKASLQGEQYVVYCDEGGEYLESVQDEIDEIYATYQDLFQIDKESLGTTRIYLDGREHRVVDHSYSPNLLGYYVPFFNTIRIDTRPAWAGEGEALRQVLLHEIAHHFFVTKYPEVAEHCWLNEGLAGNLEVSLSDGEHHEFP